MTHASTLKSNQRSKARRELRRAIRIIGGPAKVGRLFNIKSQAVSQWDICPDRRVIGVEQATGGQSHRCSLRPDLYPPEEVSAA